MSTVVLPAEQEETPSVTYAVIWIDENGDHVEAHNGLSREEANAKAKNYKQEHGFHCYSAVEESTVPT